MPFPNKDTQWQKGQSGNPAGKPKGAKHINTWIQELLEDEDFAAKIRIGFEIKDFKGAPLEAMIKAQMIKAIEGDTKAFDTLAKYGWSQKQEIDTNVTMVQPILGGASKQDNVHSDPDNL